MRMVNLTRMPNQVQMITTMYSSQSYGRLLQGRCSQSVADDKPWRHRQFIFETRGARDRALRAKVFVGEGDRMSGHRTLSAQCPCFGTLMWLRTSDGFTALLIPALAPYPSNRSHG